jgi:hypothetical protein
MTPSSPSMYARITLLMMIKSAMMTKSAMMMPKVTSLMDRCLLTKRKRCPTSTFFYHLQDDITEDYDVEVEGCTQYNEFDAEGNDTTVDPVCNVIAASEDEEPKQSIYESLSKNDDFVNPVCNLLVASNDEGPKQCIDRGSCPQFPASFFFP